MEQALADIKSRVPDFAGYADENTRRLADEQIRAIVGEALALLHFNHEEYFNTPEVTEIYDRLILRCEFTNQIVFKEFEYETLGEERKTAIACADQTLIATALRAETVTAEQLPGYLGGLEKAFDNRDAALIRKLPTEQQ
ncbi:MAG: hypothetical protein ABR584_04970 [Candidatus Baltobacteraceae bacterium]